MATMTEMATNRRQIMHSFLHRKAETVYGEIQQCDVTSAQSNFGFVAPYPDARFTQ